MTNSLYNRSNTYLLRHMNIICVSRDDASVTGLCPDDTETTSVSGAQFPVGFRVVRKARAALEKFHLCSEWEMP